MAALLDRPVIGTTAFTGKGDPCSRIWADYVHSGPKSAGRLDFLRLSGCQCALASVGRGFRDPHRRVRPRDIEARFQLKDAPV